MNYQEFMVRINQISKMGYVQSHRKGPTGIGKTLEDLLGITENNIAGPDFSMYELKSARKEAASMLTLFTKAPQPKEANSKLLEAYGYQQRKVPTGYKQVTLNGKKMDHRNIPLKEKELHTTIDAAKPNSLDLKLEVGENRIWIGNEKNVEAYWEDTMLREAFEKKYHSLIYVLADYKREKGKEYFWYNDASLLQRFSFERFAELIKEGKMKVDIRIGHHPDGRLHDHGTGFRIMPKYLPQCFQVVEKIL